MPILNYLAIPKEGAGETTCAELSVLNYGRVISADNHYFVVLVTDTPAETSEEKECQGYPILLPAHSYLRLKLTCIYND